MPKRRTYWECRWGCGHFSSFFTLAIDHERNCHKSPNFKHRLLIERGILPWDEVDYGRETLTGCGFRKTATFLGYVGDMAYLIDARGSFFVPAERIARWKGR